MKKVLHALKAWGQKANRTIRFVANMDIRVLADSALLLGGDLRQETLQMLADAEERSNTEEET